MKKIIDFHTHAFPDALAERAMRSLEDEGGIKAHLDGKITSLLRSMDANGIEKSVICSIATRPSQFGPILAWSKEIRSDRIIPFPSLHPEDTDFSDHICRIKDEGFKGVKFHSYYQDFSIDSEKLFPIYEKILEENLIVLMHTGFDFAFEKIRKADPVKVLNVLKRFPDLKIVTSHLGAWDDWAEVKEHLIGKHIYMEISFSLEYLDKAEARDIFLKHPRECIFFGTDSPWTDQGKTLELFRSLGLGEELNRLILRENAMRLLDSV